MDFIPNWIWNYISTQKVLASNWIIILYYTTKVHGESLYRKDWYMILKIRLMNVALNILLWSLIYYISKIYLICNYDTPKSFERILFSIENIFWLYCTINQLSDNLIASNSNMPEAYCSITLDIFIEELWERSWRLSIVVFTYHCLYAFMQNVITTYWAMKFNGCHYEGEHIHYLK